MTVPADTPPPQPTVHASAVLVGDRAVLIRGPSGAGKSRLAFELILAGRAGVIPPTTLVGDDRLHLRARNGALFAAPAGQLAGLIEIRGLGVRRMPFTAEAAVAVVVDLAAADAARLPSDASLFTELNGIQMPRIPVATGQSGYPLVLAALITAPGATPDTT